MLETKRHFNIVFVIFFKGSMKKAIVTISCFEFRSRRFSRIWIIQTVVHWQQTSGVQVSKKSIPSIYCLPQAQKWVLSVINVSFCNHLRLNGPVPLGESMLSLHSTATQKPTLFKVLISFPAAFQYSSANGPIMAWCQLLQNWFLKKEVDCNLVGNYNGMVSSWCEKMGLLLKSQKSVMYNDIFHFVESESHDKDVSYVHATYLLILLILFFVWVIFSNLLIPMKKTQLSSLAFLWGFARKGVPQKTPPRQQWQWTQLSFAATISFATDHSGSCNCTNGCSPLKQHCQLDCLLP